MHTYTAAETCVGRREEGGGGGGCEGQRRHKPLALIPKVFSWELGELGNNSATHAAFRKWNVQISDPTLAPTFVCAVNIAHKVIC